jgi:1D-myo-inositol-triphosphate 3-kinase
MDCKLGARSFQEKERKSEKARYDLYQRLLKIGPQYLTEAEREKGSITKYKWMSTRDEMSSLRSLCFRVDGIAGPNGLSASAEYFADISARDKVVEELRRFLDYLPLREPDDKSEITQQPRDGIEALDFLKLRLHIAKELSGRLHQLHSICLDSAYVRSHEFVGTSLLLVVEALPPRATVNIIDFAKTTKVPEGVTIDHMRKWEEGNHEDGLLFGLIQCKSCWDDVIESLQADISGLEPFDMVPNEQSNGTPRSQPCYDILGWLAAKYGCSSA